MKYLFLLLVVSKAALALEATVDFTVENKVLKAVYKLDQKVDSVGFGYELDRSSIFPALSLDIKGDVLSLTSTDLESAMNGEEVPVFIHENNNALIYTPFFDLTYGVVKDEAIPVQRLTYRYNGKVLHVRNVDDYASFERYLVLLRPGNSVIQSKNADFIFDSDLARPQVWQEKLERSLQWLYDEFGPPSTRPVIFFTSADSSDFMVDGRAIIGGHAVQITVSKSLDPDSDYGKLVLYHSLFSHEVAHHWSLHNIDNSGDEPAWIHEGLADMIAVIMTDKLYATELGEFASYRANQNIEECEAPTEDAQYEYNCGFLIYKLALEDAADAKKVIKEIIALPVMKEKAVLKVLSKHARPETMKKIREILKRAPKPSDE